MRDDAAPSRPAVTVQATGTGAAAVEVNRGVVQTGAGAQARVFAAAVALGSPSAVPVPPGGLLGLPKPTTRMFVGRDDQLEQLDVVLRARAGGRTQTVHGLGGVGKSELALQYADRHQGRYTVVWWVVAEDREKIESGLAELAFRLHPDVQVIAPGPEAATWAVGWLQSHDGWLLVLDNVEDRRLVEPLLGQLTRGHVLITTRRNVGWEDITDGSQWLDVLDPAAAVDLLTQVSGGSDPGTAGLLALELGCLPLALQQAGAYLRQTRTSMERYLQRLRIEPAQVLAQVAVGSDSVRAVARTWSLTVAAIVEQNNLAMRLLHILSCLAPDGLPRDVLHPIADPDDVDAALGLLASYNMITLDAETVTVHRLVQAVTASQLRQPHADPPADAVAPSAQPQSDWDDTLHAAVNLLDDSAPPGHPGSEVTDWPRWAVLIPHVAAVADMCSDATGGLALARLLSETAIFHNSQGRYEQALTYEQRALAITEAARGPDHPDIAIRLSNLAVSLQELGRSADAEPLHRRAVAVTETALGPDHTDMAVHLDNLAVSLQELGRPAEAEALQRRAVSVAEAALGPDHPDVALRLGNLARSLQQLGRPTEAEPLNRRALAVAEAALGPDHPDVAVRLDNLALSLQELGRSAEAEPLHRRALAVTEAALGPDHPDIADRLDNLALSLQELGRSAEAEPLHRRALAVTEATLGPEHPDVAVRLNNLAASLQQLGRPTEAEPLQRRALTITEATHGPDHPVVAIRLDNLALSLRDLGRPAEAEPLQRRALTVAKVALGPDHLDVAIVQDNLALTLQDLGRPAEAEPLQRRALAVTEATLGPDHPDVATRLDNLAATLHDLGRPTEAIPLERRAEAIIAATLRVSGSD